MLSVAKVAKGKLADEYINYYKERYRIKTVVLLFLLT